MNLDCETDGRSTVRAPTLPAVACAAFFCASQVFSAEAQTGNVQSGTPTDEIPEIVVTATLRAENLRDIPASITAITGAELERRNVQNIEDIAKLTPGVTFTQPADGALRISMRGISADPNTNPTTGVLFGDVSFTDGYLPRVTLNPNPFDLKDVEVLKGPQGTLYGAGSLNGAIRYVPEEPRFGQWETKYFAQYMGMSGDSNGQSVGGAFNVPFGDVLALRVVAVERKDPGYVDNRLTGQNNINSLDQDSVRAILAFRPVENFQATLTYAWQQLQIDDAATTDNRDGSLTVSNHPRSSPSEQKYSFIELKTLWDLDWATFVFEGAYIRKSYWDYVDASSRANEPPPAPQLPVEAHPDNGNSRTVSEELRLTSNDAPGNIWKWVTGAYASRESTAFSLRDIWGSPNVSPFTTAAIQDPNYAPIPLGSLWALTGQPDILDLDTDVIVKELAWFGNIAWRFAPNWDLSAGGRFYRTSSGGTSTKTGLLVGLLGFPNAKQTINDTIVEQGFDPKASLTWHATDNIMTYAAISKGFRVGGVQPYFTSPGSTIPAPNTFKSDSLWNYEIGTRTQWLQNTLHIDVTAFYERWKDPQVFVLPPGQLIPYLDNVGGVNSEGGDVALQYLLPIPGLSFKASAAYTHAVTTQALLLSNGTTAPSGSDWPATPKWQTSATLAYERNVGQWNLGSFLTHSYISRSIYALSQPDAIYGYYTLDAQLSVGNQSIKWLPDVSFIVNNLSDQRGITNAFSGTRYNDVTYIPPRTFFVRVSGHF
ncbi:MAG TPA: TonB-dependent receptor [Steroidobacteraceae bacterium]